MPTQHAVEESRKKALEAAEACIQLLKQRFGARRVLVFGSLAQQGVWHEQSDIDLAVEGLAPVDFFPAYSACRDMLPRGLELDLVPLEDAYPEMRARILGEVEMPDDPLLALQALVEDELVALERVSQEMQNLLVSFRLSPVVQRTVIHPQTGTMMQVAIDLRTLTVNGLVASRSLV